MLLEKTKSKLETAVSALANATESVSVESRVQLCQECLDGVAAVANEWAEQAAIGKGLSANSTLRAEDLMSGPTIVLRQLQLTIQTLASIQKHGRPTLTSRPVRLPNGQLSVPIFPTIGLFDSLTFMGIRASVRLDAGVDEANVFGQLPEVAANGNFNKLTAVLGAGNVSSIPATDSLNRIMFEGHRVLLKLNPVNEYLFPIFERAFAPLINANLLRILKGGADIGTEMIQNELVHDVHITGSAATHDAIVWGSDPSERTRRKQANDPLLKKNVTSELGNVSPWIVMPGNYSASQLESQAQHVAASITNNASFNCLATKMIVTWKQWHQRDTFLERIQHYLSKTPVRPAYYPGAVDRFQRFSGSKTKSDERGCLPWTLLKGQSIDERPELFQEESFVCLCAETQLGGDTPERFLSAATEFVNDRMTGTLCASITVLPSVRKQLGKAFDRCLTDLRYGAVCVNQWSGLAYALISPPWGAYPGATLDNVQSGIGSVHNTYLLDQVEKTVLEGPLVNFPKPVWFASHRNPVGVVSRLLNLYHRPSMFNLPGLFACAIAG